MVVNNPTQRCTAEAALLSPFFSIPFGTCRRRMEAFSPAGSSRLNSLPSVRLSAVAPHIQELVLLPSPVLRLINLIDDDHLNNDEEYEGTDAGRFEAGAEFSRSNSAFFQSVTDIMDDMKEECQKYGSVVSLLIPRENPGKGQVRSVFTLAFRSKVTLIPEMKKGQLFLA